MRTTSELKRLSGDNVYEESGWVYEMTSMAGYSLRTFFFQAEISRASLKLSAIIFPALSD